jgi:cell division protein FtsZ
MSFEQKQIAVIGIGGAGVRIVGRLAAAADGEPVTFAVDSDTCALVESEARSRLQVGEVALSGFGSAGNEEKGVEAMEESAAAVLAAVGDIDIAFIVVGLGGGVGTGGAPVLLKALREAGIFTFCFATLPFGFEGRARQAVAERGLALLDEVADTVVHVANDRLFADSNGAGMAETFRRADGVLGGAVHALWQMLVRPGYIRVGFEDLKRLAVDTSGTCTMAFADAGGDDKARRAVEALLASPLSDDGKLIGRARLLLLSIVGGPDLSLKEIGTIMDALSAKAKQECRVVMGTALDDAWVGRVSLSLLIGEKRAVRPTVDVPTATPKDPAVSHVPLAAPAPPVRARSRGPRQGRLPLDVSGRGRFKDVEPTILNGEDLDVPTFIRRGIKIER